MSCAYICLADPVEQNRVALTTRQSTLKGETTNIIHKYLLVTFLKHFVYNYNSTSQDDTINIEVIFVFTIKNNKKKFVK